MEREKKKKKRPVGVETEKMRREKWEKIGNRRGKEENDENGVVV